MYVNFFGFDKRPFSLSPDTGLFVNLTDHERCFSLLIHVLDSGEGFLKVVGDVGTGKTILCRKLLRYLEADSHLNYHTVYIPNPMLSPIGLYRAVGQELGLDIAQREDNDALLHHITEKILSLAESQKSIVIVVDEAQSLPAQTLEALRLITNLETESRKLVQIILFGQTELDTLLNQDRFRQLRQRITFAHYLKPLNINETKQYLEYRLNQSGYNGSPLFSNKAMTLMHKIAHGIPRMINVLAHKSLMAAYADQSRVVDTIHVQRAAKDSDTNSAAAKPASTIWFVGFAILIFIMATLWRWL